MKLKVFFLLFAVWFFFVRESSVTYGEGVVAPMEPLQTKVTDRPPFSFKAYTVVPLAALEIEARVLSIEHYRFDRGAKLSPVDLVLGWGRMSDEKVLDAIDISQSGRWYHWASDSLPIPRREIETHSANMHIIPADDVIEKLLGKVRRGDILHLKGWLIRAEGADGSRWVSSLTRTDTGAHACEVLFVREAERVYR